jgi:zinc/manganese transport system substrate-binding protein
MIEMAIPARKRKSGAPGVIRLALMNIVFSFTKRMAAVALLLAPLAACTSSAAAPGGVAVVASTNVWADVAQQVAGRLAGRTVHVSAIITDPAADPHAYEVSTRDELAIKRADLIVENGGGYDDFVATMRSAADAHATVLDAVRIAGRRFEGGNEHVWYDFPAVARVAGRIADALAAEDAAHAATYRANARAFTARLTVLEHREAAVKARYGGAGVAITEPVPLYLLGACGLVNRTPPAFSKAVEDEQDVAVRVLQQTRALFGAHRVQLLVYNAQTSGPETSEVRDAARAAGVPAVGVTETVPAGRDYLGWMTANLAAVERALGGTR